MGIAILLAAIYSTVNRRVERTDSGIRITMSVASDPAVRAPRPEEWTEYRCEYCGLAASTLDARVYCAGCRAPLGPSLEAHDAALLTRARSMPHSPRNPDG